MSGRDVASLPAGRVLAEVSGRLFRAARAGDQVEWLRQCRVAVDAVTGLADEEAVAVEVVTAAVWSRVELLVDVVTVSQAMMVLVGLPPRMEERLGLVKAACGVVVGGDRDGLDRLVAAASVSSGVPPVAVALQLWIDSIQVLAHAPGADRL